MLRHAMRLAALSLVAFGIANAQDPISINVEKMSDQPLPVSVLTATLQPFQFTSQLSAQLSSDKSVTVRSAEMLLYIYRSGKVVSGEGWVEDSPGGLIHHETKLPIEKGDHALLIVKSIDTGSHIFKLNAQDIGNRLPGIMNGEPTLPLAVEISLRADQHAAPK